MFNVLNIYKLTKNVRFNLILNIIKTNNLWQIGIVETISPFFIQHTFMGFTSKIFRELDFLTKAFTMLTTL